MILSYIKNYDQLLILQSFSINLFYFRFPWKFPPSSFPISALECKIKRKAAYFYHYNFFTWFENISWIIFHFKLCSILSWDIIFFTFLSKLPNASIFSRYGNIWRINDLQNNPGIKIFFKMYFWKICYFASKFFESFDLQFFHQ